jgi:hypothetical protein
MEDSKNPTKVREVVRLTKEMYEHLEKTLPPPILTDKTTDLSAGYILGVQATLKRLREGFVVG